MKLSDAIILLQNVIVKYGDIELVTEVEDVAVYTPAETLEVYNFSPGSESVASHFGAEEVWDLTGRPELAEGEKKMAYFF